jgi:hypothetical protein
MRQIIYTSVTTKETGRAADDCSAILRVASGRNGLDGITGLLYTQEDAFLQVIEGPEESVAELLESLHADPRHRDIRILLDQFVEKREFGDWMMLHRDQRETADEFDERLRRRLMRVSPETASYFKVLSDA